MRAAGPQNASPTLPEGVGYFPQYLDSNRQEELVEVAREVVAQAPLYRPSMPGTGKPFSVQMTNAGPLGWMADRTGYRYSKTHPETEKPWPEIPTILLDLWKELCGYPAPPECCLINHYDAGARMGLHQDRDEIELGAPVISVSLGDSAVFRLGGENRRDRTISWRVSSGDIVVLANEARLCYHGIDRVISGSSRLLKGGGRLNLTLRRVNRHCVPS